MPAPNRSVTLAAFLQSLAAAVFGLVVTLDAAEVTDFRRIPLAGDPNGIESLTLAVHAGVTASMTRKSDDERETLCLTFDKTTQDRRLVAIQAQLSEPLGQLRVLSLKSRLEMCEGATPKLALIAFEDAGGVWYRISHSQPARDGLTEVRIPLNGSFQQAKFSVDNDDSLRWEQVDRVWIALLLDGPVNGEFDVAEAVFTDKPFHPAEPLSIEGDWEVAQDPAMQSQLTTPADPPCVQFDFRMPAGRHMFAIPRVPVNVEELDGYSGLQFSYQAKLPPGINGLLVMLVEGDGTQYLAGPAPPASDDWRTLTIPFTAFRRGGWSNDENDQLDLNQVRQVAIGLHGTTTDPAAQGQIRVRAVQFVP